MVLSACNDISNPESTPQVTASPASPSAVRQPSQTLNANPTRKTTVANPQVTRENYKPISLASVADGKPLTGSNPKAIAVSTFGNIESEGGSQQVTVDYPQSERAIVTITQTGVADDSVGGIRHRVELQQTPSAQTQTQWKIVWAGSQVKCHPGRGHQDWSKELCL